MYISAPPNSPKISKTIHELKITYIYRLTETLENYNTLAEKIKEENRLSTW